MTQANQENTELLLWVDCEFTGLSIPEGHKILEIGAIVTDLSLQEIVEYTSFIHYDAAVVEDLMCKNPWWDEHARDKPRMLAGVKAAPAPNVVDDELAGLVTNYFGDSKPALCGNSIHSDKSHIDAELGGLAALLSYQIIDVSTIKLVAKKYLGAEYTNKKHLHYAIDDIRESVDEMRFLLAKLGITRFSQIK